MKIKTLFFIWLAVAFSVPAHAGVVKEVISPGGIKAWLVEEHSLPLVAVQVAFEGAGHAYDAPGLEGRANMAAALLSSGAGDLDEQRFTEALEALAIRFATDVDEDMLQAAMQFPSEHSEKAFTYLGMALAKPRFDNEAVQRTRRQMLSLLAQQEQSPQYQALKAWNRKAFGSHPYGKPQVGEKESLPRIGSTALRNFTGRYLTRGNMLVSVVGDITPEALGALLDTHFAGLPAAYNPDAVVPDIKIPAGDSLPVAVDFAIPQTMVLFGGEGLKRDDPDYIAAYVMNQILGGESGLTSRLGVEIREKRGLAYSAYSYLQPLKHAGLFSGGFSTRNAEAEQALSVLLATLRDFAEKGPTDKELADAKQYLTGSFALNLDSNGDIARFLINMQTNRLGIDYLDRRNALVEAIGKDDVMRVAKRLIAADKLIIVTVGKPGRKTP